MWNFLKNFFNVFKKSPAEKLERLLLKSFSVKIMIKILKLLLKSPGMLCDYQGRIGHDSYFFFTSDLYYNKISLSRFESKVDSRYGNYERYDFCVENNAGDDKRSLILLIPEMSAQWEVNYRRMTDGGEELKDVPLRIGKIVLKLYEKVSAPKYYFGPSPFGRKK